MKAVLISIQPRWCEKIAAGHKTDEIRKNAPRLPVPFKCYIYQTKMLWLYPVLRALGLFDLVDKLGNGKGKVIGEFVCDKIEQIDVDNGKRISKTSCVSLRDMWEYARPKSMFDLKAWHISNPVIYDNPKSLTNFVARKCLWENIRNNRCVDASGAQCADCRLKRPPQSWCYVEEITMGGISEN